MQSRRNRQHNICVRPGGRPTDKDGNLVGKGDFAAQAEQVYKNVQAVLAAAGATMHDVVRMNSYLTRPQDLATNFEIRLRYYTQEPPAATLVLFQAWQMRTS